MRRITLKNRNRGSVLLLTAILLLVLIGVAALAVDVSRLHVAKQQTQNVCDACALAGAWQLEPASGGLQDTAISAAQDCATANNESQNLKVLQSGTGSPGITVTQADAMSISVKGEAEVQFGFARIFGSDDNYQRDRVASSATAVLEKNSGFEYPFVALAIDSYTLETLVASAEALAAPQTLNTEWWHKDTNERMGDSTLYTVVLNGVYNSADYQEQFSSAAQPFRLAVGNHPIVRRAANPVKYTLDGLTERLQGDQTPFEDWQKLTAEEKAAFPAPQHFVIMPVLDGDTLQNIVGFVGFYVETVTYDYRTFTGKISKTEERVIITGHFVQGVVGPKSVHWLMPFEQATDETNLIYRVRLTN